MNQKLKINKKALLILVAILLVIIVVIIILCSGKKGKTNDKEPEKEKLPENYVDVAIIKDADYNVNIKAMNYIDYFKKEQKFDIVVPYIKLDNASKLNKEIEKLYKKFVNTYNECYDLSKNTNSIDSQKFDSQKLGCTIKVSYTSSIVNDIISILITKQYTDNLDVYNPEYYVFNYDTKANKILSYDEVLALHSYTRDSVGNKIINDYKDLLKSFNTTYTSDDYEKTNESILGENIVYLTSDGKLGLIYTCYISKLTSKPLLPVVVLE